ncbi:hypothetical protein BB934_35485 (plasmid) [Microvirga ossetica]|uniref:Uncharacterized protein n=1 Tax=Microvirga ossetica TaxID=1882682 RepID=A0A1B2EUK6_9HYPH|nr:hypothetical protein [Microvirga ossetica]ANY83562.1 hypothetical protein BB934_35485 [Microvirga ossetica]
MSESVSDHELTVEARLEAHALLDRLTRDGQTFAREDARRLIALLPVTTRRRFSFTGLFQGRGPGFRGRAAGVGDVELDGEGREKRVSWNTPPVHRIGGYLVTHTPGQVVIELLWIATREDASGQSCQLLYDADTGEPRAMEISIQRTLTLLFVRLAYITYAVWKTPDTRTADHPR